MACAAVLGFRYYVILRGADERQGSEERERYGTLRQRLSEGGMPTIVYNRWLKITLKKVDEFFGDAGRKDRSRIARVLHLETDGPRWTAPAFDRCLLLALIYPIVPQHFCAGCPVQTGGFWTACPPARRYANATG
jgi:hypothetical protein